MIGRLCRSVSGFSISILFFGCILFGVLIKEGDFPYLFMPSHDYDDVLEQGLKCGQHIKGDLFYSLGSFASKESYTQYENSRTAAKTNGYYYLIPVGDGGMAAVYIHKDDLDVMEKLTEETYAYLEGGSLPQTKVHFEGVAVKMEKNLKGLENAFREELESIGYTKSDIEKILASSGGECLVLYGPANMSIMYIMLAIAFIMVLVGILLILRNYKEEAAYDKMNASHAVKYK
ncbi:DUF6709 family protein [Parablautia muri]|uniref:Uncharacterized protein n=1 Tax=Parablautia muri TaxID=2320879 RepID=A0A9X5BGV0_9FIRM|nr:DUF6709 family protein [Parablautia muri]NBJ93463.1 hypothetical protein [Parablautia muri]